MRAATATSPAADRHHHLVVVMFAAGPICLVRHQTAWAVPLTAGPSGATLLATVAAPIAIR
ncbi:hypothetical protein ACIOGT_36170 [Streptomyces microflavus]|uniref:hypothetical protein n=1 Tax=Streptomyces microflavus TaxID=1919 RepID=UPI0037FEBBCC